MVSNPRRGDAVTIRYKKSLKSWFPLEGKTGTIHIVCKARRCRNHGVLVDGRLVVVPCATVTVAKVLPVTLNSEVLDAKLEV